MDMFKRTAWSRSSPILIGRSQRVKVGRSKPAICSCSETVSAFAIENGPGPQRTSSGSSGSSRYCSATCSARWSHSLSSFRRQTTATSCAAGLQGLADVAERLNGVGEEHHAHSREGVVVGAAEIHDLNVPGEEVDVLDAGLASLRDRRLDERLGDVDAHRCALRADQLRELLRRIPEAAADVEDPVAWARRMQPHRGHRHGRLRPTTMRSRNSTKRSKRTPLQASVASSFSAATRTAAPLLHGPMVRRRRVLLHIRRDPDAPSPFWSWLPP